MPLLFSGAMLFVGVFMLRIIRPLLTNTEILTGDVLVVAVMSLIGILPFGLLVRGIRKAQV